MPITRVTAESYRVPLPAAGRVSLQVRPVPGPCVVGVVAVAVWWVEGVEVLDGGVAAGGLGLGVVPVELGLGSGLDRSESMRLCGVRWGT